MKTTKKENIVLFMILILGLALRVWGIDFGLPDLFHADEPNVVNRALAYGTGDLNPHYFKIPPLVSYVLFGIYGLYFVVARTIGVFSGMEEFKTLFFSDPSSFYLVGRGVLGALLGSVTIYALYYVLSRSFSKSHGLLSAAFLAFNFLHVRDSHYIYLDIPLLCVLVLAFHFIFRLWEHGRTRDYVWSGAMVGLAAAVKYNGIFLIVPFLTAHFLRKGTSLGPVLRGPSIVLAGFSGLAIFILLNPFSVLDFQNFISDFFSMKDFLGPQNILHHFGYSLAGAMGAPLLIASLTGLLGILAAGDSKRRILASFAAGYYALLCFRSQPYDRYVLPLIPFLCFCAADLLIRIKAHFRWPASWAAVAALGLMIPGLARIYLSDLIFSREDTRTLARNWVEENLPPGTSVALDTPFFMPRLKPTLEQLEKKKEEALKDPLFGDAKLFRLEQFIQEAKRDSRVRFNLFFLRSNPDKEFLFAQPNVSFEWEQLKSFGIRYVIIAPINEQTPSLDFYEELRAKGRRLVRFSPYEDDRITYPIDRQPLTAGPFLWRDLISRTRNGQILELYQL